MLLAAIAGVVALGWITGRYLPLTWHRRQPTEPIATAPGELPLDEQMAAVERGAGATIHVAAQPVERDNVVELSRLHGLQILLLDHLDNAIGDRDCLALAQLTDLIHLRIRGGSIGDEGVAHLAALPRLKILNLPQCRVSNRGLAALADAPRLSQLRLGTRQITDEGLTALAGFPALRQLHLIDAPITDEGLKTIAALPKLESLYLDGSLVTEAGLDGLFRARPDLHVHINQQHHDRDPRKGHD